MRTALLVPSHFRADINVQIFISIKDLSAVAAAEADERNRQTHQSLFRDSQLCGGFFAGEQVH
jgi:hypothetical protein